MASGKSVEREDRPGGGRYVIRSGGALSELTFQDHGTRRIADHTFVPPAMRGGGVAARLVEALVADARLDGVSIVPQCSYVATAFRRHPEWQDLLATPD